MQHNNSDSLELFSLKPAQARAKCPPLLFLHGAYTAAWCWTEHFLPYFANAGFECHALSFSGHGESRRRDHLDSYSISDYVEDVAQVAADLYNPPVLIGHSMGGFVVQKYLEAHPAAAAILMCSVPPQGLAASAIGMMFRRPSLFADLNRLMSGGQVALDSLREALFAQPVSVDDLSRFYHKAQPESHRAIWDMTLFNLPRTSQVLKHLPNGGEYLNVIGADHDMIIPASLVELTARGYGVQPTIYSGMGHGIMLEANWRGPAQDMISWLNQRFP